MHQATRLSRAKRAAPRRAAGSSAGARAGVKLYPNSLAKVPGKRALVIQPQNIELADQRIVTMPRIAGPALRGLPGGGAVVGVAIT